MQNMTKFLCNLPEALSWKEIGIPAKTNLLLLAAYGGRSLNRREK